MIRSFPLELEYMIVKYSIDELRVLDAQRRRAELRLVCRAWRDSIDLSRHLIAHGSNAVERAGQSLEASGQGSRIKSVHLYLERPGTYGLEDDELAAQALATVSRVLALVPNATAVELVGEGHALSEEPTWDSRWTDLSPSIIQALSHLPDLTSLRIGPDPAANSGCMSDLWLDSPAPLLGNSPRLASLDLTGCRVIGPWPSEPPSTHATALSRLVLGPVADPSSGDFFGATKHLPSSLSTLVIDNELIYDPDYDLDSHLLATLDPFPPGLRHLALLDTRPEYHARRVPASVARGFYDALLARAYTLKTLSISPCAVSDLSDSLCPFMDLDELRLVQGWTRPTKALHPGELIAFLDDADWLRAVAVSANIWAQWTEDQQRVVSNAALSRSIKFEIVSVDEERLAGEKAGRW